MASVTVSVSGSWSGASRTVTATVTADAGSSTASWSITSSPSTGTRPYTKIQLKIAGTEVVATTWPSSFPSSASGNGWATFGGSRSGTVNIPASGDILVELGVGIGHNNYTDKTDSATIQRFRANEVHASSASLTPCINYLRANAYSNATYHGFEDLDRQIEINPASGGDDTWLGSFGSYNSSGEAWGTLTVTGDDINSKGLLGVALCANSEVYYVNGGPYDVYSSAYTPPSNLYSYPSISGTPAVTKVTASNISISVPGVSNWVRNEGSAFYGHALTECNSAGTATAIRYMKWGQSAQSLGTLTLPIASSQSATIQSDPNVETISAGTGYSYNLARGSTYYYKGEAITKFLGIRRNSYSSLSAGVYIPYLPSITKNSFSYSWIKSGGRIYRQLNSANIGLTNNNNENIGNRYLSMNANKVLISSLSGNIWNANTGNGNLKVEYRNAAISGTSYGWLYYATNKYSESIIEPLTVSDGYSIGANLAKVTTGSLEITKTGYLKMSNVRFDLPDNNLGMGTMTATLQVSKSNTFNSITHQQTKTITGLGTATALFDPIELVGSDLGMNYVRVVWNLSSSSDYYNFGNVISGTSSIEFTGIIPKIDEFITYVKDKKIVCNVKESTGVPIAKLYIDVARTMGGAPYQSFEVTNGVDYTLPYTEPGTIWYIKARAVNAVGTVYGLIDGTEEIREYVLQIPYNTTENYDEVANPTLTAGKVQLDGKCTFTFNWTNIVTDVYRVEYNISVASSNIPISPINHDNKTSGYNYTFVGRKDAEIAYYTLQCILYNSFGEEIISYVISSNDVELDAIDLDNINYTFHTNTTYHSIDFILDSINKNNNKLVNMRIKLVDKETGAEVYNKFIGDEYPTRQSLDLSPIEEYLMDNLKANHTYTLTVSMRGMNPLDPDKNHTNENTIDVNTKDFNVYPVRNEKIVVTNLVDGKPTISSEIELKWDKPDKGDADVIDYIVAYRKQGQTYTEIYTQEQAYKIASILLDLKNNDQVYVRIGAHYRDWFSDDIIKWKDLPPVLLTDTNYIYYGAFFPSTEKPKRLMFRAAETDRLEELIRSIYIDK